MIDITVKPNRSKKKIENAYGICLTSVTFHFVERPDIFVDALNMLGEHKRCNAIADITRDGTIISVYAERNETTEEIFGKFVTNIIHIVECNFTNMINLTSLIRFVNDRLPAERIIYDRMEQCFRIINNNKNG